MRCCVLIFKKELKAIGSHNRRGSDSRRVQGRRRLARKAGRGKIVSTAANDTNRPITDKGGGQCKTRRSTLNTRLHQKLLSAGIPSLRRQRKMMIQPSTSIPPLVS